MNKHSNTWFEIDYDDSDRNMDVEILYTNKDSLENLVVQLQNIIKDESDKEEFDIIFDENQDPNSAPFQKVKIVDNPKDIKQSNTEEDTGNTWVVIIIIIMVTVIVFAVYGFISLLNTF